MKIMNDCISAARVSPTEAELNRLSQAIEELEVSISRHVDRIAPVRYNPPVSEHPKDCKDITAEAPLSPVANGIRDCRKRIERVFEELRHVTDQIQL